MCVDESTWEQVSPEMDTITEIPQEYKDKGDELIGTYICKKENMGIFNQIYMLSWILIRKEEVYLVVPCQINYLKKVQVHDFVKIVFNGNKPNDYGNYYKDFKLFKRRK